MCYAPIFLFPSKNIQEANSSICKDTFYSFKVLLNFEYICVTAISVMSTRG